MYKLELSPLSPQEAKNLFSNSFLSQEEFFQEIVSKEDLEKENVQYQDDFWAGLGEGAVHEHRTTFVRKGSVLKKTQNSTLLEQQRVSCAGDLSAKISTLLEREDSPPVEYQLIGRWTEDSHEAVGHLLLKRRKDSDEIIDSAVLGLGSFPRIFSYRGEVYCGGEGTSNPVEVGPVPEKISYWHSHERNEKRHQLDLFQVDFSTCPETLPAVIREKDGKLHICRLEEVSTPPIIVGRQVRPTGSQPPEDEEETEEINMIGLRDFHPTRCSSYLAVGAGGHVFLLEGGQGRDRTRISIFAPDLEEIYSSPVCEIIPAPLDPADPETIFCSDENDVSLKVNRRDYRVVSGSREFFYLRSSGSDSLCSSQQHKESTFCSSQDGRVFLQHSRVDNPDGSTFPTWTKFYHLEVRKS